MYRPYYIKSLNHGWEIGQEPRLISGFSSLVNARVEKGKLIKRPGYALKATTGNGNPIVGISKCYNQGPADLLVADTRRLYRFEPVQSTLTELTSGDTFTGTDWQYFQFVSWQNRTYMTNFSDKLYVYYDTDTVSEVSTGIDIERAQHMFIWKNRMFIMNIVENSTEWYPSRLRWSDVLQAQVTPATVNFPEDNYIDGEFQSRDDVPMLIRFFRGVPYVFFKDFAVRIESSRVSSELFTFGDPIEGYGSIAQNFGVRTKNGIVILNQRNIDLFDGYRGQAIDLPQLRDLVDTFDNRKWHCIQGCRAGEKNRIYMTYAEDGQNVPNKILEWSVPDNTFSSAGIAMNYIYGFDGFYQPNWLVAPHVYDDDYAADGTTDPTNLDLTNEFQFRTTPTTYGGSATGSIYDLNSGTDYAGSAYAVEAISGRFNPFEEKGLSCDLARIEFLVDTDATASFSCSVYKDWSSTEFYTKTVTCSGNDTKHWETVQCDGETGNSFRFKISHTAKANSPVIHAVRVWLKEGGPAWQR